MIRVKISARGLTRNPNLSQFVGNRSNEWGEFVFRINASEREADVWIVIEDVNDDDSECLVAPERVIFVSAESSWPSNFYGSQTTRHQFLGQFAQIFSCHDIYLPNVINCPPFLPWMINANHDTIFSEHHRDYQYLLNLTDVPKSQEISVFCSDQSLTENHRMRLRFVTKLKEHFGSRLHWFGNGVSPVKEKWSGIAPYRYTIVLENQFLENVYTEKILDAYLGLTYPIYWGAPNLSEYFPAGSFSPINIRDINGSIETIECLLASSLREDSLEDLLEAKRRVLVDHNIFNRFATIGRGLIHVTQTARPELVAIRSWSSSDLQKSSSILYRAAGRLSRLAERMREGA